MPPLDYARVYRLKAAHARAEIVINGGIAHWRRRRRNWRMWTASCSAARPIEPLSSGERRPPVFGAAEPPPSRRDVLEALVPYVEAHLGKGGRLNNIVRHILGLYHGQPYARAFRRHLSQHAPHPGAGIDVLLASMALIEDGEGDLGHDRIGSLSL